MSGGDKTPPSLLEAPDSHPCTTLLLEAVIACALVYAPPFPPLDAPS